MPDILDRFFHARSLAIVGASSDPDKLGGRPLRQCLELGFPGALLPVNPSSPTIQGVPAFASVEDLPDGIDCALIALPAKGVAGALEACARKGVPLAIVLSSGFAEHSEAGREAQERIFAKARAAGMRLVGPNSMGGISFERRISATFTSIGDHEGRTWPPLGAISIASQSGFIGSHLMGLLRDRGLGVAKWMATGNQADIDLADCIEHYARDEITRTIIVYLEGAGRPDALRAAFDLARSKGKPIIALKAGRTDLGARAVASHTASLIGGAQAYEAVFRRHGVHEARSLDEVVDLAAALDTGKTPKGGRLGVGTVSGGLGILLADAAAQNGFELPEMDAERQRTLREIHPLATTHNPVDVGSLGPFPAAAERLLDEGYDALVFAIGHFGLLGAEMESFHDRLAALRAKHPETFVALVGCFTETWRRRFQQLELFVCEDPARAVAAMAAVRRIRGDLARDTRSAPPDVPAVDPETIAASGDERGARVLLRAIGVPVVADELARDARQAVEAARRIGGPLAMKVVSPDILHKSDIGGVLLDVSGDAAVTEGFETIMKRAREACPQARLEGVMLSPMAPKGVETIVGVTRDPVFGPIVMFGLGGVFVEIFRDTVVNVAPFGKAEAMEMIRSIASFPLLAGARGRPAADLEALADVLARISVFADRHADEIESMEINPLLATPSGALALDALIVRRRAHNALHRLTALMTARAIATPKVASGSLSSRSGGCVRRTPPGVRRPIRMSPSVK